MDFRSPSRYSRPSLQGDLLVAKWKGWNMLAHRALGHTITPNCYSKHTDHYAVCSAY